MPAAALRDRYRHLFDAIDRALARHVRREFIILETGTCRCRSALELINRASARVETVRYYGFDLFEDATRQDDERELNVKKPMSYREAMDLLRPTGAEIQLYRGPSTTTLPLAASTISGVDFAFIDGGHSVATIASDWENVKHLLLRSAVVIFDDYYVDREDMGCKAIVDKLSSRWTWRRIGDVYTFPATGRMHMVEVTICSRHS